MKRVLNIGLLAVAVLSLASCDYQKYNTIRQTDNRADDYRADYRAGDPEVYGLGRIQQRFSHSINTRLILPWMPVLRRFVKNYLVPTHPAQGI